MARRRREFSVAGFPVLWAQAWRSFSSPLAMMTEGLDREQGGEHLEEQWRRR